MSRKTVADRNARYLKREVAKGHITQREADEAHRNVLRAIAKADAASVTRPRQG